MQHVEVNHSLSGEAREQASNAFGRSTEPLIGNDGTVLKTSVCDEIHESVKKAQQIEQQLQNSKVF